MLDVLGGDFAKQVFAMWASACDSKCVGALHIQDVRPHGLL